MKAIKDKSKVYLDLSKLSGEEIKEVYKIIKNSNDGIYSETESDLKNGIVTENYYALFYRLNWNQDELEFISNKTEISISEFRQLFSKGEEVLQVENKCCDNPDIRWNKVEISVGDKKGSYKDLSFNFCDNCGDTTNEELS